MFVPPFDTWLSITMPLVPPRALGDVTQLDVGAPVQVGVVSEVVIVELSRNPSDRASRSHSEEQSVRRSVVKLGQRRTLVPSRGVYHKGGLACAGDNVSGKGEEIHLRIRLAPLRCSQIRMRSCVLTSTHSPRTRYQTFRSVRSSQCSPRSRSPIPRSTVLLVVGTPVVKFAGSWLIAPPMPSYVAASGKGEHLVGCGIGGIGDRNRRIDNPRSCSSTPVARNEGPPDRLLRRERSCPGWSV